MYKSIIVFTLCLGLVSCASFEKRDTGAHGAGAHAVAPAAADGSSQGNLYYYYYPVGAYGETEVEDSGFDVFTAIILPLLILGGVLLALSSLSFVTTGRELSSNGDVVAQLNAEIEKAFYSYLSALESEECIKRTICTVGVHAKKIKGKEFLLNLAEPMFPKEMKSNLKIFKEAALSGFELDKCYKYKCKKPKTF